MNELPPIPNTFTKSIAVREFEILLNGQTKNLTLEIGIPINDVEMSDASFDWRCPIKISYGKEEILDYACGVDAFQALSLAMNQLVKIKLEAIIKGTNKKILLYGELYKCDESNDGSEK